MGCQCFQRIPKFRGLEHLEENDLGPVYGHQWRFFNAPYQNCHTNYEGQGIDQIQQPIECLERPRATYITSPYFIGLESVSN